MVGTLGEYPLSLRTIVCSACRVRSVCRFWHGGSCALGVICLSSLGSGEGACSNLAWLWWELPYGHSKFLFICAKTSVISHGS